MNGTGRRSERSSSSSDRNKVYNIVRSLAVNKGYGSSRYSKAPWYYFLTSLTERPDCDLISVDFNL